MSLNSILEALGPFLEPRNSETNPGWYLRRREQINAAFELEKEENARLRAEYEWQREQVLRSQLHFAELENSMSGYTMQEGEVYKLARSLRHDDVFALPPGVFEPEVVAVDAETAAAMTFTGVLVRLDSNAVAVFEHPDDKNFILGMVVDPEAQEQIAADPEVQAEPVEVAQTDGDGNPVAEEQPAEPAADVPAGEPVTAEMLAEWGMAEDAVCETCGYYMKDHLIVPDADGNPALQCPAEAE